MNPVLRLETNLGLRAGTGTWTIARVLCALRIMRIINYKVPHTGNFSALSPSGHWLT